MGNGEPLGGQRILLAQLWPRGPSLSPPPNSVKTHFLHVLGLPYQDQLPPDSCLLVL